MKTSSHFAVLSRPADPKLSEKFFSHVEKGLFELEVQVLVVDLQYRLGEQERGKLRILHISPEIYIRVLYMVT